MILVLAGVVVFALTPGVAEDPGHVITSVAPPTGCSTDQVLQWTGTAWSCVTLPSGGGSSLWTDGGTYLSTTKDIEVQGNDIRSGLSGTDNKRAVINLEVKELDRVCYWSDTPGVGCYSTTYVYPNCDTDEFSGDTSFKDLNVDCDDYDGTNKATCEAVPIWRTYRSCLDLQIA